MGEPDVSSLLGRELGRTRPRFGSESFTPGLQTPSEILTLLFGSAWSYRATCGQSITGFGACGYTCVDAVHFTVTKHHAFDQLTVGYPTQQPSMRTARHGDRQSRGWAELIHPTLAPPVPKYDTATVNTVIRRGKDVHIRCTSDQKHEFGPPRNIQWSELRAP